MKHIITLIFLSVCLLSCEGRSKLVCGGDGAKDSVSEDSRCLKIRIEAHKEAESSGFCYTGPLLKGRDKGAIDPEPEKCQVFYDEAKKKCDALPPAGPDDIEQVSGGAVFKGNKPVMIDGKPVCD